jgi:phenylpropionate dioxygenase-like ring-hydroxylating dioxygenase large terminal subunit
MLNREQNDLITRTDQGTPGGELMRRYWQPVALSSELSDDVPLPVDVMGEELVLFRNEKGQPQLIGRSCPHRAVDLSYGRVENGGLRCIYHGWLLSGTGRCLEQPGEPDGSAFKTKIRHPAYPAHEAGGLIFAYMGAGEAPRLPNFPFLNAPLENTFAIKALQECNYLQANEGNIDPQHLSYLHRFISANDLANPELNALLVNDPAPQIEVEETDYGLRLFAARANRPGHRFVRITNFIMPNASAFNGGPVTNPAKGKVADDMGYQIHWHVPIDDRSHWKYTVVCRLDGPVDKDYHRASQFGEISADFRSPRTRQNRYLQDRDEMRHTSFVGLGRSFQSHDKLATESQGEIMDRSNEHLGTTDRAVILMRRQLLGAIEDMQSGRDPMFVERDGQPDRLKDMVVLSHEISAQTELTSGWWRDFAPGSKGTIGLA